VGSRSAPVMTLPMLRTRWQSHLRNGSQLKGSNSMLSYKHEINRRHMVCLKLFTSVYRNTSLIWHLVVKRKQKSLDRSRASSLSRCART